MGQGSSAITTRLEPPSPGQLSLNLSTFREFSKPDGVLSCVTITPSLESLLTMNKSAGSSPRCIIIAGPNGAGKTTFACEFLSKEAGVVHFINPDLIASGLSPLRPELAALAAGRLFLRELDRLARAREDFAFESTLSGLTYMRRLKRWKRPAGESKLYICGSHPHNSRSGVSPLASDKAAITCRAEMCCAGSREAGSIFKSLIDF
jgi:hypothetical protein